MIYSPEQLDTIEAHAATAKAQAEADTDGTTHWVDLTRHLAEQVRELVKAHRELLAERAAPPGAGAQDA